MTLSLFPNSHHRTPADCFRPSPARSPALARHPPHELVRLARRRARGQGAARPEASRDRRSSACEEDGGSSNAWGRSRGRTGVVLEGRGRVEEGLGVKTAVQSYCKPVHPTPFFDQPRATLWEMRREDVHTSHSSMGCFSRRVNEWCGSPVTLGGRCSVERLLLDYSTFYPSTMASVANHSSRKPPFSLSHIAFIRSAYPSSFPLTDPLSCDPSAVLTSCAPPST